MPRRGGAAPRPGKHFSPSAAAGVLRVLAERCGLRLARGGARSFDDAPRAARGGRGGAWEEGSSPGVFVGGTGTSSTVTGTSGRGGRAAPGWLPEGSKACGGLLERSARRSGGLLEGSTTYGGLLEGSLTALRAPWVARLPTGDARPDADRYEGRRVLMVGDHDFTFAAELVGSLRGAGTVVASGNLNARAAEALPTKLVRCAR